MRSACLPACIALAGMCAFAEPEYAVVHITEPPAAQQPAADQLPYATSLSCGFGLSDSAGDSYSCDMLVGELEMAYKLNRYHALTLSLHVADGSENHDGRRWDSRTVRPFTDNFDRWTCALMAGYRLTLPIGSYVALQLGAKAGPDLQHLKVDFGRDYNAKDAHQYDGYNPLTGNRMQRDRDDCSLAPGLAYAAYANLHFPFRSRANEDDQPSSFFIGYTMWGSTARPEARLSGGAHPIRQRSDALLLHEFRVGISITY